MDDTAKRLKTLAADFEYTKMTVLVNDKSTRNGRLFFRKGKNPEILIDIQKPDAKSHPFQEEQGGNLQPQDQSDPGIQLGATQRLGAAVLLAGFRHRDRRTEKSPTD